MLAWRPRWMPVRVSRRHVIGVKNPSGIQEFAWHFYRRRKLFKKLPHHVPPCILAQVQVQGLNRHLRGLLGGEARPFVPIGRGAVPRLGQIPCCLRKPVSRTIRHAGHCTIARGANEYRDSASWDHPRMERARFDEPNRAPLSDLNSRPRVRTLAQLTTGNRRPGCKPAPPGSCRCWPYWSTPRSRRCTSCPCS